MCRTVSIDFKWGNTDPHEEYEDAGVAFDRAQNYDKFTPEFEKALMEVLEGHFFGSIDIRISPLEVRHVLDS